MSMNCILFSFQREPHQVYDIRSLGTFEQRSAKKRPIFLREGIPLKGLDCCLVVALLGVCNCLFQAVKREANCSGINLAANCANATAFARGEITRAELERRVTRQLELESRRASTGNGVAWEGV